MTNCDDNGELRERLTRVEGEVRLMQKAFPDQDYEGHRRGHEYMIRNVEAKERLATAIKEKTISALLWSVIVGLAMLMWQGLKLKLGHWG